MSPFAHCLVGHLAPPKTLFAFQPRVVLVGYRSYFFLHVVLIECCYSSVQWQFHEQSTLSQDTLSQASRQYNRKLLYTSSRTSYLSWYNTNIGEGVMMQRRFSLVCFRAHIPFSIKLIMSDFLRYSLEQNSFFESSLSGEKRRAVFCTFLKDFCFSNVNFITLRAVLYHKG